jgi:RimJ/RimL family protein N-acetyltransferase
VERLVYDLPTVLAFVREHQPLLYVEGMQGIGLERDGELVAGVVFEGFSHYTIWMHMACAPGAWASRRFVRACFAYPFRQLGVKAVRGYVNESNERALDIDFRLGFELEARLTEAAPDGGDILILVMRREACRYV